MSYPSSGGVLNPYQDQHFKKDVAIDGDLTVTGDVTVTGTINDTGSSFASPVVTGTVTGGASYTAPTLTSPTITGTTAIGTGATLTTPVLSGTVTGTYTLGGTPTLASAAGVPYAAGLAAGYKVARGVHTQVAASDTVVTGLATVVAVTVSYQSAPTVKQLYCAGSIGNQSGAPAAGSILINTYKPTATNDCTPTAATDFSENLVLAWHAIGT